MANENNSIPPEEEIKILESYLKSEKSQLALWTEIKEESQRHIDFTKGIALGLFYGIVGNIFVQFLYPTVEGIILRQFEWPFLGNAIIAIFSLVFILYVSWRYGIRLTEKGIIYDDSRRAIEESKAIITRLKHRLEILKKKQFLEGENG